MLSVLSGKKLIVMHFNILTLFPEMFPGPLGHSLSGKALERGDWSYNAVNIRDFAEGVHKSVDDTPYGGGAGMVMRADIIEKALLAVDGRQLPVDSRDNRLPTTDYPLIYLSPRGKPLTQKKVQELSQMPALTLLCGRYEGVDQRVLDAHDFEEISVGDYVLSGGEPAAMVLMDACIRLLPGVMGNTDTPLEESFSNGLLEYPHYTRPAEWNGLKVPEVLQSGDHARIQEWREKQSLKITESTRPDLLKCNEATKKQS